MPISDENPGDVRRLIAKLDQRAALADTVPLSEALPSDVVARASGRLQAMALTYATVFLFAGVVTPFLAGHGHKMLEELRWVPATVSISVSLLFWWALRKQWLRGTATLNAGLGFGVLSGFGIAFAEFWDTFALSPVIATGHFGLSWVAVWALAFAAMVPNKPWRTFAAALGCGSSVPIVVLTALHVGGQSRPGTWAEFFAIFVFPYVINAVLSLILGKEIFQLGTDVKREREMGSYRLVERIGKGGMGEVWRAEHRMLARPAAVKLINVEALQRDRESADNARKRFEREASATAMLRSPHTVELYDYGQSADGTIYYVMELLEGVDLDTLVGRFGPQPPSRVIYLLRQACASLEEAHQRGLLHRDVKPANMFASRLGTSIDFLKVVDFGLAKVQSASGFDDVQLTAAGATTGTPAYMAPELVTGGENVDGRADLYSLGCVAFWLLTGRLVFPSKSAMRMMVSHARDEPPAPSSVSELSIPAALDEVVLRCLAKDPDDRPQSASELAELLDAVECESSWDEEAARPWWDTHLPVAT